MSILVCGGAGYIGSHCVRELKKAGYDCIVYDNLSEGHPAAVTGFKLIEGDIRDGAKLDEVFADNKIEGVIHFAAFALVGESTKDPVAYYENNVSGTVNLLKVMKKAQVNKIVFSSTCAVYGETEEVPITEKTPTAPCNPYGQTKRDVEQLLSWCDKAYGIKSVCLRYFNAAGATPDGDIGEDHTIETHLIPLIFQAALCKNKKLAVYGNDYATFDGSCVRDYIHVLDLADAHVKAMRYLIDGNDNRIFNLGSGTGSSVFEVIKVAQEITGCEIPYLIGRRRQGDPAVLVASAKEANRVLGWHAERSDLENVLKDAWRWHSAHPKGYQDKDGRAT